MKNLLIICYLIFSLIGFSNGVRAIPLNDLPHDNELSLQASDFNMSLDQTPSKKQLFFSVKETEKNDSLLRYSSVSESSLKKKQVILKDEELTSGDETDFYLFEQEELDAQKPGLELYQTLAPMLSPELKKDAKKIWAETADFREAIDFSTKDSDSKELILQQSSKEMTLLKGKTLEELSNKNLPPALYDKKEPDKAMVRELFDGIYDLLKNAFLIIAGILILGKTISFIVKKIIAGRERRKKRQARRHSKRHSKRHRKKRRRTYA
ncbi:MAG: hypothetical protein KAI22_11365 [Gammaproteobacteria bacterium]|nr:hypothetical protein [Gammaproteobacteria bacterium]